MTEYARIVATIVLKDVRLEARTRQTLIASTIFTLLVAIIFAFALDLAPATARAVAPGLLWATLAFAGILGLGRSFAQESDHGTLDGLRLAPVDPSALYVGKMCGNFLLMLLTLAVALPAFTILLGVDLLSPGVFPAALLGLLGFAAAGTLFSALSAAARTRDVLLPILFLPLAIPVILTATGATRFTLSSVSTANALGVLLACDALYVTAAVLLFIYTLEE
ncbi:MAG TPA: heme exporter protein CcmB [Chloroflexota bacterium]|nr:heme exporter protein CcmB [Chloroflexota bacterium]